MSEGRRARPQPTPETQHFWDGTREGQLRLQRCNTCGKVYFPPRPFCPACAARDVAVFAATGKGRLYSYVIHHRPVPGFTPPYAIAVVELDEGPRMMTNIIDCPPTPEALQLDMALEVAFEKLDDEITLPVFRPAGGEGLRETTRNRDAAEIDRHRRRRRDHQPWRDPRHVADPIACRRRAQCDGRCRAQARRYRRHRDRRRDASDGRALSRSHARNGSTAPRSAAARS